MFPSNSHRRRSAVYYRSQRSMALVTVLLMIAVISVTVIAVVVGMQLHKTASFSYSQAFKADQLAQGGAWWTVKELQEEMQAAQTHAADLNFPAYPILTNLFYGTNMMPQFVGTNADMVNLVKTSTNGTSAYYANSTSPYPNGGVRPSPISTSQPSFNGRYIDTNRWSAPCLGNFTATNNLPFWIMVTRSGPTSIANPGNPTAQLATFVNPQDQANYVIGRYAYAMYDEGGLIDVNVAGYPSSFIDNSSLTSADLARKGSPGLMDLTAIPGLTQSQIDQFITNRNAGTAQSMQLYTNYLYATNLTTTSGPIGTVLQYTNTFGKVSKYLYVPPGDNFFLSRQDLIAYTQAHNMTNILPYVTTFSRDLNVPSWTPFVAYNQIIMKNLNVPSAGGSAGTIAIPPLIAASYQGQTNGYNPNVSLLRQAGGTPFVPQRFPLTRLGLFADPTHNTAAISNYFGLTNNSDGYGWTYYRGVNTIAELYQVATNTANPRSPDFFELLQAGVLRGSVPPLTPLIPPATPTQFFTYTTQTPLSPWVSAVVMQMGVNIIDQYTSDNWPTIVNFNGEAFAGSKSLPLMNEFLQWTIRPSTNIDLIGEVCPVEFWNPYQNATTLPATGPSNLRLLISQNGATNNGVLTSLVFGITGATTNTPIGTFPVKYNTVIGGPQGTNANIPSALDYLPGTAAPYVQFPNATAYSEPTLVQGGSGPGWVSFTNNDYTTNYVVTGFLGGNLTNLPDARFHPTYSYPTNYCYQKTGLYGLRGVSFITQFQDNNGLWHAYQGYGGTNTGTPAAYTLTPISVDTSQGAMSGVDSGTSQTPYGRPAIAANGATGFTNSLFFGTPSAGFSDPRSYLEGIQFQVQASPGLSIRPNTTDAGVRRGRNGNYVMGYSWPYTQSGGSVSVPANWFGYEGMLNENTNVNPFTTTVGAAAGWSASTNTYQYDVDGFIRPGDGFLGTNANPFLANSSASFAARPIILNRPFRSVAEMGFAFRGQAAWKSVNFFDGTSGDAGLLDLFGNDQAQVVAGKINLNTRQPVTLQAALQGAYKTESPFTTNTISESSNFAQAIVAYTESGGGSGGPAQFNNRADLVRQFVNSPQAGIAYGYYSAADFAIKSHREAIIRPLAEMGTTRTWNMMIDVIAQVGHYPPNASDLSQFVVEGERRYWLHVAIDRVTGQVIDYKMELYNE